MNRTIMFFSWLLITGLTLIAAPAAGPAWAQKPAQSSTGKPRLEKDLLGEKEIPADAYYGVQTARALENFQISGVADQSLSRVRRSVGHREAGRGAGQHRRRRDEEGAAGRHREGVPGRSCRASITISFRSTGTRAAPARPRT